MPSALTYPGVYVEEIPSGVRTITGVATSITAFVGRAARGPVDDPVVITSYADFERRFGGLWRLSTLGFAVRDFFQNGGSRAIVVRLYRKGAADEKARLDATNLVLEAAHPGSWGNALRARIETGVDKVSPDLEQSWKSEFPDFVTLDLFNLIVRDMATGVTEEFRNVTVEASPRPVVEVLESESQLVRALGPLVMPAGHTPAPLGTDPWGSDTFSTGVDLPDDAGSDGDPPGSGDFTGGAKKTDKEGLYALEKTDLFNLLCIPPYLESGGVIDDVDDEVLADAAAYCKERRAMLLVDAGPDWTVANAITELAGVPASKNAAVFFPRLRRPNPLREGRVENFAPCGAVAGIFARTDTERGVWKAPAGLDARIVGAPELSIPLTDAEVGLLNPEGINCLRTLPAAGRVVWGARTLEGADRLASEWKYIPVRRTALYIEESLYRGTQWVVFEPNDETLWSQIRLNVGAFMQNLFRQGAFQGKTPREAYLVKCDGETTTQTDINLGVVNILVGFAPLKPAEFVVLKIQQLAGQIEV